MKVTKAYYHRFKKEFLRLQQLLGLTQYRIDFFQKDLTDGTDSFYAQAQIFEHEKFAKVVLTTKIENPEVDPGPESHALHEACHLLIHRLTWLGEARFLDRSDIDEEAEAVVTRLEKVLK